MGGVMLSLLSNPCLGSTLIKQSSVQYHSSGEAPLVRHTKLKELLRKICFFFFLLKGKVKTCVC